MLKSASPLLLVIACFAQSATAGTASFGPPVSSSTFEPTQVVLGHFTGSGHLDAVVNDVSTGYIALQRGEGDGTFGAPSVIAVGGSPYTMVSADLNGDGIPDLIVGDLETTSIQVYLCNGDGTFRVGQTLNAGPTYNMRIVDFNGDGKPDVVVIPMTIGSVILIAGNGDGTFGAPQTLAAPGDVMDVAVGDVNGDSIPDIVLVDYLPRQVMVLTAQSPGVFSQPVVIPARYLLDTVALSRDPVTGSLDIVVGAETDSNVNGMLLVYKGDGAGGFAAPANYGLRSPGLEMSVADINGDGFPDVTIVCPEDDSVSVSLGVGDGTYGPSANYRVGFAPYGIAIGDVDEDGMPDIVTADLLESAVTTLINQGKGTFRGPDEYRISLPSPPADLAGDGFPDVLALANVPDGTGNCITAQLYLNDRHGTLIPQTPYQLACGVWTYSAPQLADINGDGLPDLIATVTGSQGVAGIMVAVGNGDGTFQPPQIYLDTSNGVTYSGALYGFVTDVDGDGRPDIILNTVTIGTRGVKVFIQQADGSFVGNSVIPLQGDYSVSAVADMNKDGHVDLLLTGYGPLPDDIFHPNLAIMYGTPGDSFASPVYYPYTGADIAVADVNNDGWPDVIAGSSSGFNSAFPDGISVMLNAGDGTLKPWKGYAMPRACLSLVAADFNGDGSVDVACYALIPGFYSTLLGIMYNDGSGGFPSAAYVPGLEGGTQLYAMDMNGDGKLDIVAGMNFYSASPYSPHPEFSGTPDDLGVFFQKGPSDILPPNVINQNLYETLGAVQQRIPLSGFDSSGAPMQYQVIAGPAAGTLSADVSGADLVYTPNGYASDEITLQATSADGTSNIATITVQQMVYLPYAPAAIIRVDESGSYQGVLPFTFVADAPVAVSIVTSPAHGSAQVTDQGTGAFQYQATAGYQGLDYFEFKACNPAAITYTCAPTTVTMVNGPAPPPQANDESFATLINHPLNVALPAVPTYVGQILSFHVVKYPAHGRLTMNSATGKFRYIPKADFRGLDSFQFDVTDSLGQTSRTATIAIRTRDLAPISHDGKVTFPRDHVSSGQLAFTKAYPHQAVKILLLHRPYHGTLTLNTTNGAFTYRPAQGYAGPDKFIFQIEDSYGLKSRVATESITVH